MAYPYNLKIAQFIKLAGFFVYKICKGLEDNGQMPLVAKWKKNQQCSDSIRTHKFLQQVKNFNGKILQKLMRSIAKGLPMKRH